MPVFPTKEAQIYELSAKMVYGLKQHYEDFPSVQWFYLRVAHLYYRFARLTQINAVSRLRLATKDKNEKLRQLKSVMKECLKKSQVDCYNDPKKLALIGWATDKQPSIMPPPGQPLNLRATSQSSDTVTLKWDRPSNGSSGGHVRNYLIHRRDKSSGEFGTWRLLDTVYHEIAELSDQPRNVQMEYRVKAANTAGESNPSNSVSVVL